MNINNTSTQEPQPLNIAVRAWAERDGLTKAERKKQRRKEQRVARLAENPPSSKQRTVVNNNRVPDTWLIFDTETTTDVSQQLNFGCCRVVHHGRTVAEYLFYADNLPERDPAGFAVLQEYASTRPSDAQTRFGTATKPIVLLSRSVFTDEHFYKLAYLGRALVIGFNLPFDLTRIAQNTTYTSDGDGFSLQIFSNPNRPHIQVWIDDSKRARIRFTRRRPFNAGDIEQAKYRGRFLDCRTLAFALTDSGHSLLSACKVFGVEHGRQHVEEHGVITAEYIDYCRNDVLATHELAVNVLARFSLHPIALRPWQAKSAASIGKAYLDAMGIAPRSELQPDFDKTALGEAMVAYYGGRVETKIRRTPVPVVYLDFTSMYPTVNGLMGLWRYLIAERVEVQDATAEVAAVLDTVTLETLFKPETWRAVPAFVELLPDGAVLPVRAQYDKGGAYGIGLQNVTSEQPLLYTLADCIASKLLTRTTPRVRRAWKLVPVGVQSTLQPVMLAGEVPVDPAHDDFFRLVIEARNRRANKKDATGQFLKVLANATSYGIYVEMNPESLGLDPKKPGVDATARVQVYGLSSFATKVAHPEQPGRWCFPPLAATITGAARLMLALLETLVREAGGTFAFCDTDSMAIVASEAGGLVPCEGGSERMPDGKPTVRALSWSQVEQIRERFSRLNPYEKDAVPGSVLKLEDVNLSNGRQRQLYAFSISSKRYALYTLNDAGEPELVGVSAHGLGAYLDPESTSGGFSSEGDDESVKVKGWHKTLWRLLVREALGLPLTEPDWFGRVAMRRMSLSKPSTHKLFRTLNDGRDYAATVKPANFLLSPQLRPAGSPPGVDRSHFTLIAPFEADPARWERLDYLDRYSGVYHDTETAQGNADSGRTDRTDFPYRIARDVQRTELTSIDAARTAEVVMLRDIYQRYRVHPERKRLGPDGRRCRDETIGELQPMRLVVGAVVHCGKESNHLEERESGEIADFDDVQTTYGERNASLSLLREILGTLDHTEAAKAGGISRQDLTEIVAGRRIPKLRTHAALHDYARRTMITAIRLLGDSSVNPLAGFDALAYHYSGRLYTMRAELQTELRALAGIIGERGTARVTGTAQPTLHRWLREMPSEPEKLAALERALAPHRRRLMQVIESTTRLHDDVEPAMRERVQRDYERGRSKLLAMARE